MSRSPLAYPLARGIDGDSGGAADLQTDIMRFMAILSLCLMAIFALVQSIPIAPDVPAEIPAEMPVPAPVVESKRPVAKPDAEPPRKESFDAAKPAELLVRPAAVARQVIPAPANPASTKPDGFTLRFESDLALTRLVAAGQVGFYSIAAGRAQRMAVGDSRISFWSASVPGSFHEMDASTVPKPVVEALARTGVDAASVDWGVTLPGRLSSQLANLMRDHSGGALVIDIDGNLLLEES